MKPIVKNDWQIYFHPIFFKQWEELVGQVKNLQQKLAKDKFVRHPNVKLIKAIDVAVKNKIPNDPFASYFALKRPLQKYKRQKKMGLPARYRLFFRVFPQANTIIILWLGFPRKQGDKKDCYSVFSKLVSRGEFPDSLEQLLNELKDKK